jgi:chorismate mutase
MSLAERVAAAKAAAEAKYAGQHSPLDPNQQAEILIAQVQAIAAGDDEIETPPETFTPEPEAPAEEPKE